MRIPEDWASFARLTQIRSGGQIKSFEPYPYQLILSELLDRYSNLLIIKSRQMGVTQLVLGKFLHRAAKNPAYSAIGFFRNGPDAQAIALRVRQMTRSLAKLFSMERDNAGYMRVAGGGEIYYKNSGKEGSRSYDSVCDFLFDEAAFSSNIGTIFSSSSPSSALVSSTTKVVVSTPKLKSGWFWERLSENNGSIDIEKLCASVASGDKFLQIPGLFYFKDITGLVKVILHWRAHPVYAKDANYLEKRLQEDNTTWPVVLREYDLRFIETRKPFFDLQSINKCIDALSLDPSTQFKTFCGIALKGAAPVLTIWECFGNLCCLRYLYDGFINSLSDSLIVIEEALLKFNPLRVVVQSSEGSGKFFIDYLS